MIESQELLKLAEQLRLFGKRTGISKSTLLRRTISTAYYALFHYLIDKAACDLAGSDRGSSAFRLVYRSFDHGEMKRACEQVNSKQPFKSDTQHILGIAQFCPEIRNCAASFVELQQQRHRADYDPGATFRVADTKSVIEKAKSAIESLTSAPLDERRLFLLMLRFKIRS
jgi:uncharacterized protein (UPF0332 family)